MGIKLWRDNPAPQHDRHTIEKTGKTALSNACFTLQIKRRSSAVIWDNMGKFGYQWDWFGKFRHDHGFKRAFGDAPNAAKPLIASSMDRE